LIFNIYSLYVLITSTVREERSARTKGTNRINFITLLLPVKEAEQASEMCISNMPQAMDNAQCIILIKGHAFMQFKDTV
jgi:hypothetical protein